MPDSNTNHVLPERQLLQKHDKIIAKIQSVFAQGHVGMGELEDFADFMCRSHEEFATLYRNGAPKLAQALSLAAILILR